MSRTPDRLPIVVFSSVVRSTKQSESHGGVYLLDLETDTVKQMIDWDDQNINWEERGGDRGLRGIAFHGDLMYLAASDEVFVYDRDFQLQRSFKNRYLKHCHEINVGDDKLFLSSIGCESILEYDLITQEFTRGYCLRYSPLKRKGRKRLDRRGISWRPRPGLRIFDPNKDGGPAPGNTTHPSFPKCVDGTLYVAGGGLGNIWAIEGDRLVRGPKIPFEQHNAQRFRDGVLLNHSPTHRMIFEDLEGNVVKSFPVPVYDLEELEHANIPRDHAYQGFCRGIAPVNDNLIVQGSSPATINLFQFEPPRLLKSVNITKDVRNSVHGLEIWPFGEMA
jgi:hypothetical protein